MMNATFHEADANDVEYVLVPVFFGLLFYASIVLLLWPYGKPLFPLWILVFAIFFPPLLLVLLFYALCILPVAAPPPRVREVVVVSTRRPRRTASI